MIYLACFLAILLPFFVGFYYAKDKPAPWIWSTKGFGDAS